MIRTLPLQFQANTVTEVQFNQFDPHSPPATVLINNPGDYWIFLTNIKQWIPPNTPNASYRWNGDMYAEVHTDRTPSNQFGFVPGTNQSTEACTITWSNDPTVNPTGAANQFKVVQYPPTLIGKFVSVANTNNQHFPTQVNNGVPGVDTYLLPAGTQSVIIAWSGDDPAIMQSNAPIIPLILIVGNSDGSIFWGGFNITAAGTGGSFSDSVFQCAVATAVDNGIRILLDESTQAQTYYVLASPVPVAETVTIAGSDVAVAVNLQEVNGAALSTAGVPVINGGGIAGVPPAPLLTQPFNDGLPFNGVSGANAAQTVIIPAPPAGQFNRISQVFVTWSGGTAGAPSLQIQDSTGAVLWEAVVSKEEAGSATVLSNPPPIPFPIPLKVTTGTGAVHLVVSASGVAGTASVCAGVYTVF